MWAPNTTHVRIQPAVHMSILAHYARRKEGQLRVIGTLLGSVKDNTVDVMSCFPVPHQEENDEVAVDMGHHVTVLELYQKADPEQVVVGWYATGARVTEHSALIHEFYAREAASPVHLCLDATLAGGKLSVAAFVAQPYGVPSAGGAASGTLFVPVPTDLLVDATDNVALDALTATIGAPSRTVPLSTDLERVSKAIGNMQEMLTSVVAYVEKVKAGTVVPDVAIGHFLLDTVAAVPKLDPTQFERLLQDTLQDLLMVTYLANLTRTQVAIQEKINRIL